MSKTDITFIIALIQDINTVRPLAFLAAREADANIRFIVSWRFARRDTTGLWLEEIRALAQQLAADVLICESVVDAYTALQNRRGILIAGVDSDIQSAHGDVAEIYAVAPPGFIKITLQHGLECVGFRQNKEHIMAHGRNVTFNADVICAWMPPSELTAMVPSQRAKLVVTGPQMLLTRPQVAPEHPRIAGGMICENLHSVRLSASGDHGQSFMGTFAQYCDLLAKAGGEVTLRPHPGGQYVIKNNISLPSNVVLNNLPIYKVNLSAYEYGISAPSTVILDMVLAGIPVGVWRDQAGVMDASMYDGLTPISELSDWIAFLRDVRLRREAILDRQDVFLDDIKIVRDPAEVYRRFARLLVSASATGAGDRLRRGAEGARRAHRRVLFFANSFIPTLQLSFVKPLKALIESGNLTASFAFEEDFRNNINRRTPTKDEISAWVTREFDLAMPDYIVACRYSGPGAEVIAQIAKERGIPLIYHIDDDLLNIPIELGARKQASHMHPSRTGAVRHLLSNADLVYCSTTPLKRRFREQGFRQPMRAGEIYCSGDVISPAELRPVTRIGYMGFDHVHDFAIVVPALVSLLERHAHLEFELFGSVPMPDVLSQFGERVRILPPVRVYEEFMAAFAERQWDIGIAPLADLPFNRVKANTKWVEYTAVGAAVVATAGTIYDGCGADGRAALVPDDGWLEALDSLVCDADSRYQQVVKAQAYLRNAFSVDVLRRQVLSMLDLADGHAAERGQNVMEPAFA